MALTDGNENGMVMPVQPMYGGGNGGGFGFGGDWAWIILLLLLGGNGWGGGFGYGMGGFAADGAMLYPWMNQSNQINGGFRDQMINDNITSVRDGIHSLQTQLCNCCGDVQMSLANGFAGVEQGANARQIANMQQAFAAQTAVTSGMNDLAMGLQNCCCENRAGIADLKYTVATENCADRTQAMQNTRDIIDSQTRGTQAIIDKLCQLELDGVKAQVEAKNDRIAELQTQLNMANLAASQTAQNAFIAQGFANEVDQLYTRLSNCPVPSVPVYGRQNIFTCPGNNGCGCGCGM
jgi:hypothetical protein